MHFLSYQRMTRGSHDTLGDDVEILGVKIAQACRDFVDAEVSPKAIDVFQRRLFCSIQFDIRSDSHQVGQFFCVQFSATMLI